jgi:hypothetical protein
MKRFSFLVISFLTAVIAIGISAGGYSTYAQETKGNISFQWVFGSIKKAEDGPQFEVIKRDTVLKAGDQIKFFLNIESKCFVYLIYQSSQGDLSVLFPYRFKSIADNNQNLGRHYIPKGDQWFELDEYTGTEKFYLLASADRLEELESLVNDYENVDKSKKIDIGKKIVSEISRLRKQHFKKKRYAEKPVTILGTMRGSKLSVAAGVRDIADHAVEISATDFFSRSFTIEHK